MIDREVRHLATAVIFQAIRDAQLIEVGHRFHACVLESWPEATRRQIIRAREWLMNDQPDTVLLLWSALIEVPPDVLREGLRPRLTWTHRMESEAMPTQRSPRGTGSPFRRRDEGCK
jgi:hypothetical protein|tara:strand:+ start:419 stop:769 length:351 start_codon:yes stop_codon:yes gene_type:complete